MRTSTRSPLASMQQHQLGGQEREIGSASERTSASLLDYTVEKDKQQWYVIKEKVTRLAEACGDSHPFRAGVGGVRNHRWSRSGER
jgi:myo-inositol-hexaphosphate 3-phosphohydrolase